MGSCSRVVAALLRAKTLGAWVASSGLLPCAVALSQTTLSSILVTAIPAQPLSQALASFADQTGLQLVYVSGIVRNQKSHAVAPGLGASEALLRLLRGTGLRFEFLTPRSIRILTSAAAAAPAGGASTDEVIVTANRRREALQDVPITVQVLTGPTLEQLNATTFEDILTSLPGVTAHGVGPSQNTIYMRGLGTGELANQAAGSNGIFPNVAVYLDEQSAQLPGRNLDIYAADLDRIEVLQGPQGTLFGAGAEAGVLRYITNKPKLGMTEFSAHAGYSATAHGDPGSALDAVINLPLIDDELALRALVYNERRGGYINNVPGVFARTAADPSIAYANAAGQVPANSVVINNANLVARDINPVTYQGLRVQALYQLDPDWEILLAQSYQSMQADGVFAEMQTNTFGQPMPDLSVQLYNPSYDKDRFENTALTIDGHAGPLQVLYAGSYLVRNVEQVQDYTAYAHAGLYIDYYQCVNPGPTPATARCFTPSATWHVRERNTHQGHEVRVATPAQWRIRGVSGIFYENYRIQDQGDWFYLTAIPYFQPIGPPTGYRVIDGQPVCGCTAAGTFVPGTVTSINPSVRAPGDGFFNDVTRGYRQKALYGSIDADLVPERLTLTAGTRYFRTESWEVGSLVGSYGCQLINNPQATNPCLNQEFANLDAEGLRRLYSGFTSRANLSWKASDDALLYYTWSQGFRAGGFNRGLGLPAGSPLWPGDLPAQAQARLHSGWVPPVSIAPDKLINNEVGWKTSWLEQRLQWNGALYQEDWLHAQATAVDETVLGDGTINGASYRVRGAETAVAAHPTSELLLELGAAWNHSEMSRQAAFFWTDGTPIDFKSLRIPNPVGNLGSPLAGAPALQANIRARYELAFDGYRGFAQFGAMHQSSSLSSTTRFNLDTLGNSIAYELPGFTTLNAALGVARDAWTVQIYGDNLTDTRAQLFANDTLSYKAVTVNRPRTIGLRWSYRFEHGESPLTQARRDPTQQAGPL